MKELPRLKAETRAKIDEFTTAALICSALLLTLILLRAEKELPMFKQLTGGLKSKTTIAGVGAGTVILGNALVGYGNGGEVDWMQVVIGIAIAVVGALSKDHKQAPPQGPNYRNLN